MCLQDRTLSYSGTLQVQPLSVLTWIIKFISMFFPVTSSSIMLIVRHRW